MKTKPFQIISLVVTLTMILAPFTSTVSAISGLTPPVEEDRPAVVPTSGAQPPVDTSSAVEDGPDESAEFAIGVYGFKFDPLGGEPSMPTELRAVESAEPSLHLVQFTGPTDDSWLAELSASGLKPLQYYAHYAYLVWGTLPQVENVDSESYVRWSGAFHPAYKLNPTLDQFDGLIENVAVTFYNDGDIGGTLKALGGLGKIVQYWAAQPDEAFYTAILTLDASHLTEAAAIPTVWAVEYASPEPGFDDENANQIVAGNTPGGTPVAGYYDWLQSKGVSGYGVTWADVDTGLNSAHPDITGDPAMYPSGIAGTRVVAYVTYPGAPPANTDPDGHGSHTAGAIFGDGRYGVHQIDPTASQDSAGMFWGTGMAPSSTLVVQNALYGSSWPPAGGWNILSRDSVLNGAVGSSNSWYTGYYDNSYTAACREHDLMVRDAVFATTAVAEPIIYVFSAGNGGPGVSTLSEPHASKNPIIVGASSNYPRSLTSIDDLADFSSRGPTSDGRFNPQVVAPGDWTTSLVGDGGASCYGSYPPGSAANYYHYCSGTSMSCPVVAGASALIVDWWQQDYGMVPSPAMVKALLVNGADDMAGGDDGGGGTLTNIPNFKMGWGRTNTDRTIRPDVPAFYEDQQTLFGNSGEVWQQTFVVADPSEPVKVSLAWTDAAGAVGANPALVNDLNLVVNNGADTYLGNVFAGGWSATGGAADALNNVENVFLPVGTSGSINITVNAFNIAGDGVPYNGDDTDQDFALVCYNCLQGSVGWLEGTVYDAAGAPATDPLGGVAVWASPNPTQTVRTLSDEAGYYWMGLVTDTYTVAAGLYGYTMNTIADVSVISGTTTTLDIPLTQGAFHVVSGTVTDATTGWPLYASVTVVAGDPFAPSDPDNKVWTDPVTGFYSMALAEGNTYTFRVDAWVAGYNPAERDVGPLMDDATENFALNADLMACNAPGYFFDGMACVPQAGGLVVGNVYDANYSATTLDGADVVNDAGEMAVTADGGFYTIFSPAGDHVFTATMSGGYGEDVVTVTVVQSDTVTQDFYLPAGLLDYTPEGLAVTVALGYADSVDLNLANLGAMDAEFELREQVPEVAFYPLAVGGPDPFGYTFADSNESDGPDYTWIEIAPPAGGSGTPVGMAGMDDSHVWPLDLPFAFNFYGVDYTQIALGSNGTIYFEDKYLGLANVAIPGANSYGVHTFIAHYWDDLVIAPGEVYYADLGNKFVIEYYQARTFGGSDPGTWQIVLFENGNILFQYQDAALNYGTGATVGIQADTMTGLQYSYNTVSLSDGLGICFAYPGQSTACADLDVPWLAESPVTGTVMADGGQVVAVDFDAAYVDQPGEYYASLVVENDTPYGKFSVPVTMTVTPPASYGKLEGLVTGLGVCDENPAPLAEAELFIESSDGAEWWMTTTDVSGTYQIWLDAGYSPLTVTVTAPDYHGVAAGVMLAQGETTVLDFDLRLLQPCLSYDPAALEATLEIGNSASDVFTLTNTGAGEAEFELGEIDLGFDPMRPMATGPMYAPVNSGPTAELVGALAPDGEPGEPSDIGLISVPYAPTAVLYDNGPLITHPSGGSGGADASALQTALGMGTYGMGHQLSEGYRIADDFTITDPAGWQIDAITFFAYQSFCGPPSTIDHVNVQIWDGSPDDPGSSVVFGDTTTNRLVNTVWSNIYRVLDTDLTNADRPIMADTVNVGITLPPGTYWLDWQSGGTCASGPWAPPITILGQTTTGNALQYTGAWAPVTDGSTGTQQGFPFIVEGNVVGSGGIPWLSEDPVTGTLAADSDLWVDITFNASIPETMQPGEYYGQLMIDSNAPNTVTNVPVTMTLLPPATWGKLEGTVTGLGYCDSDPAPLEGAEVTVEAATGANWLVTTDVSGTYTLWLDEAHSPLTVTFEYPDHVTEVVTGVTVVGEETTTVDRDLRWVHACLSAEPDNFHLTFELGMSGTLPLTLTNDGAGDATFALSDQETGFITARPTHVIPQTAPLPDIIATGDFAFSTNPNPPIQASSPLHPAPRLPEGVHILTHSLSQTIIQYNSVACGSGGLHTDNSYLRVFDLAAFGVVGDFTVTNVEVGIESAAGVGGTQPVEVRLYTLVGPLLWSNMTLIGSASVNIPDQALSYFNVPVNGVAPAGSTLVAEFFTPNGQTAGHSLFVGSNNLGQTAPTYLAAADCGFPEPTDTAAIGFPGMHLVMNVTGETGIDAPWLTEVPTTGVVLADDYFVVDVTMDSAYVSQPGEYYADLTVNHDDVLGPVSLPVTMTVLPPATWGKLIGTVTGLGYCDADPAPLEGAEVLIESWVTETATVTVSLLTEGFEGAFPPAGWTLTQTGDIADPGWVQTTLRANSGTYSAYHNDDNLTTSATSWLILPQVAIPAGGGELTFWQNENWDTYYAYHGIWVSTATSDPADFSELVELGAGTEDTWEEVQVGLSAYAGQSIYVAFRYEGDYADEWYIDDVQLTGEALDDVPMSWLVTTDVSGTYSLWMNEMYSPLTVTVTYPDHETGLATGVSVTGGMTATENFNLRWLEPCVSVEPAAIDEVVSWGASATVPISLSNTGAVATPWNAYDYATWLSANPTAGTLAADTGFEAVTATLDAAMVDQPGVYTSLIQVVTDDPVEPNVFIPVTMTVPPDPSWGVLEGTVTSLGHCDVDPEPLAGATVVISNGMIVTLTTDVSGTYSYWLPNGSYAVTVSADDHVSQTLGVSVVAVSTTTQDFSLRWLGPCVDIEAVTYELTLPMGMSGTLPLTLTNAGAGSAGFAFREQNQGFHLSALAYNFENLSIVGSESSASIEADNGNETFFGLSVGTKGQVLALPNPWVVIPSMPVGASRPAGAAVDAKFYVIGGEESGGARSGYVQIYDPDTGTWDNSAPTMPTGVSNLCTAAIDDDIYVPGGYNGSSGIIDLQVFHTDSNTWETIATDPMPAANFASACATYDGKLYVFGGDSVNASWVYDPAAPAGSRWDATLSSAPVASAYGAALAVGDLIFYSGLGISSNFADVYAYAPATDTWITYPSLNTGRGGAGMWAIGDMLYVGGGGWSSYLTSVEEYDTSLGTGGSWSLTNPFVQGRRTFAWASSPETGRLYVGAGWASAYLNEAEETAFPPILPDVPWLFETPITGTVPADGGQVVADITMDAAYVWMPGEYYAMLLVDTDDEDLDTVSYPVTLTVTLTDTYGYLDGTVYSRGYCDAEMNPLEEAEVLIESTTGISWTVTTDVSGTFDLWLDEAGSPYTVTAMANEHETAWVSGVLVTGTETTTVAVALTWSKPCASVAPDSIHEVVTMGMSTTVPMSIGNTGAYSLSWSLREADRGFQVMAPNAGEDVLVVRYDTTAATAMETALTNLGYTYLGVDRTTFEAMAVPDLLQYQAVFYAGSSSGDSWTQAMAYLDAGGSLYISENDVGYYNNATIFYQTYLQASYVSDDPGINTLIGEDIMAGLTVDISTDPWPDDFTVGAEGTRIFQFSGGNAAGVKVARNGYKAIYTSFDFDEVASATDEEAIVQRAMDFLGADVPWLDEDPTDGETAPAGTSPVTITLDASVPEITQPGDYYATLIVSSDDPVVNEIGVPVTMTVPAPTTWGKLEGTIIGLGYCDVDPAPIDGAVVFVESGTGMTWTVTTDVSGTYVLWLDEMYSPLTVTASYEAGYEAQTVPGVSITAQTTTTLDFDLYWLEPCISMSRDSIEITLALGETGDVTMNMINDGALHSWFGMTEFNVGMDPMGPLAAGGPDGFGYQYADSNEGVGPAYDFVDISGFGVPLALGDNEYAQVDIGFDFAFYGADRTTPNVYDTLFVGSNGFLSFGSGSTALSNQKPLPDSTLPNNLIAAMWDDLDPGAAGIVYYQSFDTCPYNPWAGTADACLVVQYDGYEHAGGGAAGTFEVVLFRTGSILMQFAEADAPGATTGIENALGLVGLNYGLALADELAICFAYPGQPVDCQATDVPWLALEPEDGSVDAHSTAPMTITFDAGVPEVWEPGVYMAEVWVQSHDPIIPFHIMPVTMTVTQFGGKLAGTVTGWGYCDATSETLEGVELWIEGYNGDAWQVETDVDGDYQLWLDEGDNPYTIMVAHEGYVVQTLPNVDVTNAATTQFNLDLRVDQPCFSVAPQSYDVILAQGRTHTETLDLVNAGAGLFEYYDLASNVEWLRGTPTIGTIVADSTGAAVLTFDATEMAFGPYSGILEVTHNDAEAGRTFVRPIDMLVVGYMLALDPITDTATGEPGTTVAYNLTLTNNGTYTDTFDVAVAGGAWTTTVPSAIGPLGVGASTALNVSVDIPATAQEGYSDTVTVTVTSQGDGWQTADAMLTTTAMISEVRVFLPLVLRNF